MSFLNFKNFFAILTALVSGVVCGSFAALVLALIPIYVYVVFPVVISGCAVWGASFVWRRLKISYLALPDNGGIMRQSFSAYPILCTCLFSASVSYISFYMWNYLFLLARSGTALQPYLLSSTGNSGFWGFMKMRAGQPFSSFGILRGIPVYSSSEGQSIPFYHWFMWSLDFFAIIVVAFFFGIDTGEDATK